MSNARHRKRTSRLKPTAAAVAVASASCGGLSLAVLPASAQTSSSQTSLPEVRVTAQPEHSAVSSPKATAPLRDTPQTVSVIPESVFTQQGARTLTEVLRNTPGITFSAGENGFSTNNNNFGLRGFDSSSSVFVDGVRDSGNYARDAFNIEQVEVVKGSSADLGRGGPGGYVNLVTKSPKRENFTNGSVSYGFDSSDAKNRWRAALDANRTFSDSVAGRLNLLLQDGGVAGREHAKQRSVGIAPSLSFGMGTPTRVDLAYQHVRQDDRPDWGVPAAMLPGTMRHDPSFRPGRDTYYGLLSDFDDTRADTFTARVEHRLSTDTTITNLTRWSRTRRDAVYTIPFSYDPATVTVTTQRQAFDRDNGVLANQTNLSTRFAAAGLQHRLSAGVELSRETSDARRFGTQNNPGTGSPISGYDPDPSRAGPWSDLAATQTAEVEVKTVAAYVYDTVELSPRWQLTGGVRLEHYSVDISSRNVDGTPLGQDGYDASKTSLNGRLG
ncbi:MAG: TonB-dependent receptor, partial [Burkholderiaceae bacterium]